MQVKRPIRDHRTAVVVARRSPSHNLSSISLLSGILRAALASELYEQYWCSKPSIHKKKGAFK